MISTSSFSPEPELLQKKVLLVEDLKISQKLNNMLLQKMGCVVDIAQCGREAIDMANNGYDLILLDIGLPDIDGFEVCKTVRSTGTKIPIVALTAFSSERIKDEGCEVGLDCIITKPIGFHEMKLILCQFLGKNRNTV
jgi:DNA-binding response OmpR family regulator